MSSAPTPRLPMGPTAAPPGPPGPPGQPGPRRAYRDTREPVLGGVASGLARHLGVPVLWLRAGFVVATALSGMGIVLYGALWLFLPADRGLAHEAPGLAGARRDGRRPGRVRRLGDLGPALALAALALGVLLAVDAVFGGGGLLWPLALGLAGLALLWRQADEVQRERWTDSSGRLAPGRLVFGSGGWASYARVAAGALLLVAGLLVLGLDLGSGQSRGVLLAGGLGVAGLALVAGPVVMRLAADLSAERAERIRSQERADVAAHLHDSVLQTLALIQRNADDGAAVARLARAQERDLRSWLFHGDAARTDSLAAALREVAATAEDAHGVVAEVVAVGDCDLGEQLRPLVAAAGEAVANAARHAGTGRVDVYAEVGPRHVEVFVRDRGGGFDPDDIPADRLGVRHSIVARMERHGGTARVHSMPGEGTEVRLAMPREERP